MTMTMSSETSSYLGFADGVFDAYQNRYKIRGRSAAGGQGQHGLDGLLVAVDHARRAIWIGNIPTAIGYGRHSSQLGRFAISRSYRVWLFVWQCCRRLVTHLHTTINDSFAPATFFDFVRQKFRMCSVLPPACESNELV